MGICLFVYVHMYNSHVLLVRIKQFNVIRGSDKVLRHYYITGVCVGLFFPGVDGGVLRCAVRHNLVTAPCKLPPLTLLPPHPPLHTDLDTYGGA